MRFCAGRRWFKGGWKIMVTIYYFVHLNARNFCEFRIILIEIEIIEWNFQFFLKTLRVSLKKSFTIESEASNRLFMSQAIKSTTNCSFSFPITAVFPSFKPTTFSNPHNLQSPDQHVLQYLKSKLRKASNPSTHFWITGNKNLTPSKVFCRLKVGLRFFFLLDYLETKFP